MNSLTISGSLFIGSSILVTIIVADYD